MAVAVSWISVRGAQMLTDTSKQIITGNVLLIVCCVFYILWWIIAFKPEGAIKGMKSGWLLIPAVITGMISIYILINTFMDSTYDTAMFSNLAVLIIGIITYFVLLLVTALFFHRIVTTELVLIVGWTVLALCEINTLVATVGLSRGAALALIIVSLIFGIASMICYLRYYDLDARRGWICGMIPLILVMVFMVVLSICT